MPFSLLTCSMTRFRSGSMAPSSPHGCACGLAEQPKSYATLARSMAANEMQVLASPPAQGLCLLRRRTPEPLYPRPDGRCGRRRCGRVGEVEVVGVVYCGPRLTEYHLAAAPTEARPVAATRLAAAAAAPPVPAASSAGPRFLLPFRSTMRRPRRNFQSFSPSPALTAEVAWARDPLPRKRLHAPTHVRGALPRHHPSRLHR